MEENMHNTPRGINEIIDGILLDYRTERDIDKMDVYHQHEDDATKELISKMLRILFPGYHRDRTIKVFNEESRLRVMIEDMLYNLEKQIGRLLQYLPEYTDKSEIKRLVKASEITAKFAESIPKIREYIETDLQATFEGDPATMYKDEIVMCYPGIYASTLNRIAHELFLLNVPLLPRMITEYAHSSTGIDIHPGATIGKYFFIDHGTGVVIGSSTEIGEHVKIYQGVTLGALSTRKGQLLRGTKRHPTIEDDVTIYSGASILGGETRIGKGSVIGSNAFITASVPPGSRISIQNQEIRPVEGGQEKKDAKSACTGDNWFYII